MKMEKIKPDHLDSIIQAAEAIALKTKNVVVLACKMLTVITFIIVALIITTFIVIGYIELLAYIVF